MKLFSFCIITVYQRFHIHPWHNDDTKQSIYISFCIELVQLVALCYDQPHFYDIFLDFINSWGYCSSKYLWSGMHPHFQLNSPKTNIISSYIVYCYMHLLRYTKVSTCIQYWNRRGYTNLVRESFEIEPIAHTIAYKNSNKHRKLTRGIRIK